MQKIEDKIIEVDDIAFSYGENEVLSGITFYIRKGDYVGIVGPNGAGKTTLLKIILGILMPKNGSIKIFGKDIKNFKDWPRIGYVPQKATKFDENFPASVFEVVIMGRFGKAGLFHKMTKDDRNMAKKALEQVGMWDKRDSLVSDLSGGQQQRVFIARALASEPEVVFLDEPTVGIDPGAREEFYTLLRKLNKELGLTLVLVSHDIEMMMKEVKTVVCVDRRLVCNGSPEEFLKGTHSSELFKGEVKIITHGHRH